MPKRIGRNQSGIGFIGVLILSAIVGVIAVVGSQVIVAQYRSSRVFQSQAVHQQLQRRFAGMIKDPRALSNSASQSSNGTALNSCLNAAICVTGSDQYFNLYDGFGPAGQLVAGDGAGTHTYFDIYGNPCTTPGANCVFEAKAFYRATCVAGNCFAAFEVSVYQISTNPLQGLIAFNRNASVNPFVQQLPYSPAAASSHVPVWGDNRGHLVQSSITQAIPSLDISIGSPTLPAQLAADHDLHINATAAVPQSNVGGNLNVTANVLMGSPSIPCSSGCPKIVVGRDAFADGTIWYDKVVVGRDMTVQNSTIANSAFNVQGMLTSARYNYSSDQQLKKDILHITQPLEKLSQLKGVQFNWKSTKKADIGFIAQNVEQVLPELVKTDRTGRKNLKYANILALTLEAYKENRTRTQALLDRREREIVKLERDISEIADKRSRGFE